MSDKTSNNQPYDRIFRENLLEIFLPLVAKELNVKIKNIQPLPDKQPTTVLRETDSFMLVETFSKDEPKFILHLEFESKDSKNMIYRMSEYHGIGLRKYKLPIKHVVVYLGEKKPTMRTKLKKEEVFESFSLVNVHHFSPKEWLEKDEPEQIIMAILGNYQRQNAELIISAIVNKLIRVCKSDADLKKFLKQLTVISRMRKLEDLIIEKTDNMSIYIDIEKDGLYRLAMRRAEKKLQETIKRLEEEARVEIEIRTKAEMKAKAEAERIKAEKAEMEAKAKAEAKRIKAEKAEMEAKAKAEAERIKAEKAKMEAKAKAEAERIKIEKAEMEAKAKAEAERIKIEKAEMEAKAKAEKAEMEAKTKAALINSILKMQRANLDNATIADFLNIDVATLENLMKEQH